EIIDAVVGSDVRDWRVVEGDHALGSEADDGEGGRSYHSLAVYRAEPAVSLVWGLTENPNFREIEWANNFADPSAKSAWFDIRYNGVPVLRELLVVVDGGRCYLPMPSRHGETRSVPSAYSRVVRLMQKLKGRHEYDDYFARAGLIETGDEWPTT